MSMLARLRGGHIHDFAGASFDDDMPTREDDLITISITLMKIIHTSCEEQNTACGVSMLKAPDRRR